ncbi:MAG TPA: RimK/LysX family protein [Candidatus Pseudomonas excrementavium]|uniref:retropepsin-like aspartic peptidase RloA3 n=1 Tax=Halopseudomonas bauzanensis TaxID=653930 RepID=UPI001C3BB11A|nr:RimK/LysX family protein [Halopseudomonas bauzanensis]HIZ51546.1 RimK/LysX family protein [Candidatus Pseudomonas excrementavium]
MQLSIKSLSLAALLSTAVVSNGVIADAKEAIDPPEDAVLTEDIAGKVVVGWVEKGLILPEEAVVKVKVDSGALTSSMHAVNMERFTRKGKRWVRYDVPVVDADTGNKVTLHFERPVYRQMTVRGAGGEDYRPVVKMRMCIGNRIYEEQFSLRDRSDMTYPVLLGRRTIEHIGLIDVSDTFMLPLDCPDAASEEERNRQQLLKEDASLVDDSQIDQPSEAEEEDDEQERGE